MTLPDLVTRADIEFRSDHDVKLRGWLYRHEAVTTPAPAIVMTHGWSCLKEFYLDKYAELFAQHGFFVLIYDQRNFGESEGEPRQEIDPWQQVRDYRDAITFLQTQELVDPRRIGIWGTSYAGGHVLVVSAIDKRVKCVVSQVPTISGWKTSLRRTPPGEWAALRESFHRDRLNRYLGKAPQIAPVLPDAAVNSAASHASADARAFFTGQSAPPEERWRFEKWRNEITLRSVELYSEYEPGQYITRIAPTPLLMIVAEDDVVVLTDLQLEAFNEAREPKKLVLIKGNHFDPYQMEFSSSSQAALEWFRLHL